MPEKRHGPYDYEQCPVEIPVPKLVYWLPICAVHGMDQADQPMIMVVDDDPDLLLAMSLTLERHGFRVDARVAPPNWIELQEIHPTLIFLDVELMPHNGVHICKSIKENLVSWHLPVVLTSGHPREQLAQKARYCHADAFLTKPFDSSAVERMADRYAHGKPQSSHGC